jgi:GTPase
VASKKDRTALEAEDRIDPALPLIDHDARLRAETSATLVLVPVLKTRDASAADADDGRPLSHQHAPEDRLSEAMGLARAIDLDVKAGYLVNVPRPRPGTLMGSGKVEELKALVLADKIELVIVDHPLAPIQQRNLEKAWNAKVLDRTGLILEIFGRRARTREGRLQVELAHLDYQRSRLVRTWTHLERQRGGFGFLGGPGESQLEADRRMIRDRIAAIRLELEDVRRTRDLHRGGRARVPYPVVALVGYTNAGKSTLFNRLTGADVIARDQLFATLDPTMREVRLPVSGTAKEQGATQGGTSGGRRIILSDTVGFISQLPTMLVAAFRATLEEVIEADVILHVRDISHAESLAQRADVEGVLRELGVDPEEEDSRLLEVWNKIDCLDAAQRDEVANAARRQSAQPVLVSAVSGEGINDLLALLAERLGRNDETFELAVPAQEGRLLAWLHENSEIVERTTDDEGASHCRFRIDPARKGRLEAAVHRAGLTLSKSVN